MPADDETRREIAGHRFGSFSTARPHLSAGSNLSNCLESLVCGIKARSPKGKFLARGCVCVPRFLRKALSFINFAAREINCKIVYYGAGLGGKTTNLQVIYQKTAEQQKGKMISLATETERTLFFDFLPLDLGSVRGFKTRIHLYTVPGQVFYDASRKLILRGVDGIVFVADSQEQRMDANVEALDNLMSNLKEHGYDFNKIPYVLQLNKRDLPNILPVDLLTTELRRKNEPIIEAVAFQGTGVFETLKEIAKQVLTELKAGG
jgi:signal recognition particle receptor subunit beta